MEETKMAGQNYDVRIPRLRLSDDAKKKIWNRFVYVRPGFQN
jgi:hypothetical protein